VTQAHTEIVTAPRQPVRALMCWAARSCPEGGRVLEVGAGEHASGALGPLLRRHPTLVGVDPDAAIGRNDALDERHRLRVEDYAIDHRDEFDVVLSVFVLEHVEDPRAFAAACAAVLKPGGSWFALTLNVRHYFGATAWATQRLGVQAAMLHRLKGDEAEHDHRFPTHYRFNSRRAVERACLASGFSALDFRVYDAAERYAWYLPTPLDRLPHLYTAVVDRYRLAGMMGHLSFRAQLPARR
jgi:SAM-dependent methyltransferase